MKFFLTAALFCQSAGAFIVGPQAAQGMATKLCAEYEPVEGESKINHQVDLDNPKVATTLDQESGQRKVYCRCWLSGAFPECDGTHAKHNKAIGTS